MAPNCKPTFFQLLLVPFLIFVTGFFGFSFPSYSCALHLNQVLGSSVPRELEKVYEKFVAAIKNLTPESAGELALEIAINESDLVLKMANEGIQIESAGKTVLIPETARLSGKLRGLQVDSIQLLNGEASLDPQAKSLFLLLNEDFGKKRDLDTAGLKWSQQAPLVAQKKQTSNLAPSKSLATRKNEERTAEWQNLKNKIKGADSVGALQMIVSTNIMGIDHELAAVALYNFYDRAKAFEGPQDLFLKNVRGDLEGLVRKVLGAKESDQNLGFIVQALLASNYFGLGFEKPLLERAKILVESSLRNSAVVGAKSFEAATILFFLSMQKETPSKEFIKGLVDTALAKQNEAGDRHHILTASLSRAYVLLKIQHRIDLPELRPYLKESLDYFGNEREKIPNLIGLRDLPLGEVDLKNPALILSKQIAYFTDLKLVVRFSSSGINSYQKEAEVRLLQSLLGCKVLDLDSREIEGFSPVQKKIWLTSKILSALKK
jgi:hypothetical protein